MCLKDLSSDVFPIDIDAIWCNAGKGAAQRGGVVIGAVVKGCVKTKFVGGDLAFFRPPPAMAMVRIPAALANCPTIDPTGPVAAATTRVSPACGRHICASLSKR